MEEVLENAVPQVSNHDNEENLAIDSDRVKARVVGAGSTDFGVSQKHDVTNQAGARGGSPLLHLKRRATKKKEETMQAQHKLDHLCGGCGDK